LRQAKHHVGDDSGDGDVEPEREGPARYLAVLPDAAGEGKEKGDQHQRQRHDGENDVAGQQRQIDGAQGCVEGIANVAVQGVVRNVTDQKECGEEEGGDHGGAVGFDAVGADEGVADEQRRGGEAVEDGVEGGQKGILGAQGRGGMNINKPEEKQRCCRADNEYGGDGRAGAGMGGDGSGHLLQHP